MVYLCSLGISWKANGRLGVSIGWQKHGGVKAASGSQRSDSCMLKNIN